MTKELKPYDEEKQEFLINGSGKTRQPKKEWGEK